MRDGGIFETKGVVLQKLGYCHGIRRYSQGTTRGAESYNASSASGSVIGFSSLERRCWWWSGRVGDGYDASILWTLMDTIETGKKRKLA